MKTSPTIRLGALMIASMAPSVASGGQPGAPPQYTTMAANDLLDFRYSFPTIVGTFPALLAHIRRDQANSYSSQLQDARDDAAGAKENDYPFHRHEFWRDWVATGQTSRLLGLEQQTDFFTGGAHPNHGSAWLLWDLKLHRSIDLGQLFSPGAAFWPMLEQPYCSALASERRSRDMTNRVPCPAPDKLTIEFLDTNLDWSFDTVRIIADPYVAGSYAEGSYAVTLPLTADLIARMRPEYRDSFEAQRQ